MPPKTLPKYYRNQPLDVVLIKAHCQACDMTLEWDIELEKNKPPIYRAMCNCSEWEMKLQTATIIKIKLEDIHYENCS